MKIDPRYKKGPSQNCQVPHCMGDPKQVFNAETFRGTFCAECKAIHRYWEEDILNNEPVQEERKKEKPEHEYKIPTVSDEEYRRINREYFLMYKNKYNLKEKETEQLDMFKEHEDKIKEE